MIVAPNYKQYLLASYNEKWVRIPIKSLPFLWVDYQIFLYHNFQVINPTQTELTEKYNELLNSPAFHSFSENPHLIQEAKYSVPPEIQVVMSKHKFNEYYQVLDFHRSWNQRRWVQEVPEKLLEQFFSRQEEIEDETYSNSYLNSNNNDNEERSIYNFRHARREDL
jgi:hypothetical protein